MTLSIAHRGDWAEHPENTLQAFEAAVRNGAGMLELDVRVTRDGRAVLLHDETLERIWNVPQRVSDLTWREVSDISSGPYRIPLLEDVLQAVPHPFMVDFTEFETADVIADVLSRQPSLERFLVVTGHDRAIKRVKDRLPAVTTGLTWTQLHLPSDELLRELRVSYYNPNWMLLSPAVMWHMRQRNLKISCWTVDEERSMRTLLDWGVDAMVTNRLAPLVEMLGALA